METGDYVLGKMKLKYTYNYLKNKVKIETIFSIMAVLISIFILRTRILFYPFAFIAFDILGTIIFGIVSSFWSTFYWERLTNQEKYKLAKENKEELYSWYPNANYLCDLNCQARNFLSDYVSYLEQIIEDEEENILNSENKEVAVYLEEITSFKKKFSVIKTEDNKNYLNELANKLKQIADMVRERPSNSVFSNKIFNLYLPEIIALMNNFPKEIELQQKYRENLIEVINELNTLVDSTIKTINNFNQRDADITFDVLMKEIKKAGEELDG